GLFGCPLGLTVEASGTILTSISPGCSIPAVIRIDPIAGTQSIVSSFGNFSLPYGLDTEADGNIIVADPNAFAGAIFRVNPINGSQTLVSSGGLLAVPVDV